MNNIPPRMLIKAGSTLLVPRTALTENDVSSQVADNAQVSLAPEIVTRSTTVKARKGESVTSIASRYGLAVASVAGWNNVSVNAGFKQGHQIVLHLPRSEPCISPLPRAALRSKRKNEVPAKRLSRRKDAEDPKSVRPRFAAGLNPQRTGSKQPDQSDNNQVHRHDIV